MREAVFGREVAEAVDFESVGVLDADIEGGLGGGFVVGGWDVMNDVPGVRGDWGEFAGSEAGYGVAREKTSWVCGVGG